MLLKLATTLTIYIWLLTFVLSSAEKPSNYHASPAVLDTDGNPLETDVDYYVRPAITDNGGYFTLISRSENDSCPYYAGQQNVVGDQKFSLRFTPFNESEKLIRENRDFKAVFQAFTTCIQPTTWTVTKEDPASGRRLIVLSSGEGAGGYFRIEKDNFGSYHFRWCPTEVCPICKFRCSPVGILVENGKRLLALDGNALPVIFERAVEVSS